MEDALIVVPTMRRFTGIDLVSERIQDETKILSLRHLMEKHNLGKQIFSAGKAHLKERGMAMKQGTDHGCHLDRGSQLHQEQG